MESVDLQAELAAALRSGDVAKVRSLLAQGAEPESWATGAPKAIEAMVAAGADPMLFVGHAFTFGQVAVLRQCFESGAGLSDELRQKRAERESERGRRGVDALVDLVAAGVRPDLEVLSVDTIASARSSALAVLGPDRVVAVSLDVLVVEWVPDTEGNWRPTRWVDCGENSVDSIALGSGSNRLLLVTSDRGVVEFDTDAWRPVAGTGERFATVQNELRQALTLPDRAGPLVVSARHEPKDIFQYQIGPNGHLFSINGDDWDIYGDWPAVELCRHDGDDMHQLWKNTTFASWTPASFTFNADKSKVGVHYRHSDEVRRRSYDRVAVVSLDPPYMWTDHVLGEPGGASRDLPGVQTIASAGAGFAVALPHTKRIGYVDPDRPLQMIPDTNLVNPDQNVHAMFVDLDVVPYAVHAHPVDPDSTLVATSHGLRVTSRPRAD